MLKNLFGLLLILGATALPIRAEFKAGAFAQNTNPKKLPVSLNGGFQDRKSAIINDPLHARCLVLDDGKTQIALVIVDACMIPRTVVDPAKQKASAKTGIPVSNILIAATHTHSAPTLAGVFQSDANEEYVVQLAEDIATGIETAYRKRVPAKLGFGFADNPKQLFNRRWYREKGLIPADPFDQKVASVQMNPGNQAPGLIKSAGPIDPQVAILAVQDLQGAPLALFATYSLHYVGGYPNISADYFGAFAEAIARNLKAKEGFVGAMFNGTSGDVNNINFGAMPLKRGPGEQIRIVAEDVAKSALDAYEKLEFKTDITLAAATKEIDLGVRKPTPDEVIRAKQVLSEAKNPDNLAQAREVYARESLKLLEYPDTVKLNLQAIRIGKIAVTAIPCETFTEIGLELKAKSPIKPLFTISLANGYSGYLPTPTQHDLGGYETWRARSSYLEKEASTKIISTLMELLEKVK
jgi:neutral ceramidase